MVWFSTSTLMWCRLYNGAKYCEIRFCLDRALLRGVYIMWETWPKNSIQNTSPTPNREDRLIAEANSCFSMISNPSLIQTTPLQKTVATSVSSNAFCFGGEICWETKSLCGDVATRPCERNRHSYVEAWFGARILEWNRQALVMNWVGHGQLIHQP